MREWTWMDTLFAIALGIIIMLLFIKPAKAEMITEASWYSVKSCLREGTSGIMANGRRLVDENYTCASWDYKFGTKIKVTNIQNNKSVIVEVTDRGPNKKLYRMGRRLDLSKGAFGKIANHKQGTIQVRMEVI